MSRISDFFSKLRNEYYEVTKDLLDQSMVLMLDDCIQHYKYTRLLHSLTVSYHSFVICKIFGLCSSAAARAGLLHDLFFRDETQKSYSLLFSHPKIALENAKKICTLNEMEEDIILKHMWPLVPRFPSYWESFIVSMVDKYCALFEFFASLFTRKKRLDAFAKSKIIFLHNKTQEQK